MACKNRIDVDDEDSPECGDEGRQCDECYERDAKYWADYFGVRNGRANPAMRPVETISEGEWAEWRALKNG